MATPDQIAQFKLDNWQHALAVSQQTGVDPRIVMAQAGVESDWGNAAPGNNVFGVKGPGQTLQTKEAGPSGALAPTTDSFRTYPSTAHSFADYANLPIIQKVGQAGDYDAQIKALGRSGYATDPNYSSKVDAAAKGLSVPQGVTASVLPIVQSQTVAGGPGNAPSVPQYQADPRTAGDADLGGYHGDNVAQPPPAPNALGILAQSQQRQNINNSMAQAQGLLAAGAPQQQAQQQQIPMLQQHRGKPTPLPSLVGSLLPPGLLG